jgi:hypothetical protein
MADVRSSRPVRDTADEAQLKCETCVKSHALGQLRKPFGVHGSVLKRSRD